MTEYKYMPVSRLLQEYFLPPSLVLLRRERMRLQANRRNSSTSPGLGISNTWPRPPLLLLSNRPSSELELLALVKHTLSSLFIPQGLCTHSFPAGISLTPLANWKTFRMVFGTTLRLHLLWEVFIVFSSFPFGAKLFTLCPGDSFYGRMLHIMNLLIFVCLLRATGALRARNYFLST